MQPADYNSYSYYQFPQNANPTPTSSDQHPNHLPSTPYASAPPFSINYPPSDASSLYSSTYPPPYSQNSDHIPSHNPPTAPSYPQNPNNFQSFTPPTQTQIPTFPPFEAHGSYQPPAQQQLYYPSCDKHQSAPSYAPPAPIPSNPNPSSNPPPPSMYPSQYSQLGSSLPPVYDIPYESNVKFDRSGGYLDEPSGRYGVVNQSHSEFGSYVYGKPPESRMPRYDSGGFGNDAYGDDGVYAYQGKVEPYGARGTAPQSSTWSGFDDFGRPIGGGYSSSKERVSSPKIAKAVPKADTQQDVKGGIQKFRVKLLAESGGQSTMDVLCQIGLDGIRMLDPSTNRLLRVYPLDTITRCEVSNPSTLSFWSKSSVDIEPRRIRLQSNSYTTNTLLDTITAATVQFKEIGGRNRPSESSKMAEQPPEKKKGLADWMNLVKPVNEEKDHWVPDEAVTKCTACGTDFGAFNRKHHCRNCGDIFCDKCTHGRIALTADENAPQVRVCDRCMAEVTQRLSNAKETANKSTGLQSHEDLAKKLQEEMEKNRRTASGSNSDGSGRRMKEVACPTCTVHLQVQVPSSGSETIECGVCQHPFLVSAR